MIKVVVVEDETLVRKGIVLTTPWEEYGCHMAGDAENGLEGLALIHHIKPDIVIADVSMPGLDGLEMIRQCVGVLDAEYIIISGYSEFAYAQSALKMGVRDYLVKPIDDREFEQALSNACEAVRKKKSFTRIQHQIQSMDDSRILFFNEYMGGTHSPNYINKAVEMVHLQYMDQGLGLKDVADSLFISESTLGRLFKSETGYTFHDYLTHYRIKCACKLLKNPIVKIYEIADCVGYKDQRYFSVLFKKLVGMTPSEFRDTLMGA